MESGATLLRAVAEDVVTDCISPLGTVDKKRTYLSVWFSLFSSVWLEIGITMEYVSVIAIVCFLYVSSRSYLITLREILLFIASRSG